MLFGVRRDRRGGQRCAARCDRGPAGGDANHAFDLSIDALDGAGISWLHRNSEVLDKQLRDGRFDMTVRVDETKRDIVVARFDAAACGVSLIVVPANARTTCSQRPLQPSAPAPRLWLAPRPIARWPSPHSTAHPSPRARWFRANDRWPPRRVRYSRSGARISRWCRATPLPGRRRHGAPD